MATSSPNSLGINRYTARNVLPAIAASFGALALLGGTMNFSDPANGAKLFGLTTAPSPSPIEKALIQVHGIRNIASGSSLLGLGSYYFFSKRCRDPVAANTVRKCIGITFLVGSLVGFGDGWILGQFARDGSVTGEVEVLAMDKSKGHTTLAVPIAMLGCALLYV